MNTTPAKTPLLRRITAAALLAGAVTAGGLGAAATAAARPPVDPTPAPAPSRPAATTKLYAAIAFSPETGYWASWTTAHSFDEANVGALSACQNEGGSHCLLAGYAINQCIALAVDAVHWELWQSRLGPTVISSETAALQANGGGRIATVSCTSPNGPNQAFTGRIGQLQTS